MRIDGSWLALLCVSAIAACDSSSRASSTTASSGAATESSTTPIAASNNAAPARNTAAELSLCPHDGKWALCSVERRLKQSGFVVKRVEGEAPRRAGFTVTPAVYMLGASRLEVFIYPDSASLARDVARIDTVAVRPAGSPNSWGDIPPVLIRSANLAAVILSQSQRQTERVMLALTAGPPQPGSPR